MCRWQSSILPNAQQMIEWNRPLSIKFMLFSAAAAVSTIAINAQTIQFFCGFRIGFCADEMRNEHVPVQRRPAAASATVNFIELIFISFDLFRSGHTEFNSAARQGDTCARGGADKIEDGKLIKNRFM